MSFKNEWWYNVLRRCVVGVTSIVVAICKFMLVWIRPVVYLISTIFLNTFSVLMTLTANLNSVETFS